MTSGGDTRDWDASTYDLISAPQQRWAAEQLDRLTLNGDEVVLDAGCGSGRITAELVRRVPRGRVYGVDAAPSMVAHARAALGDAATVLCQDLTELSLPQGVDVIFSNATFHWVLDHDALFAALHRALKPGGRLVAQCGGTGNIASVVDAADTIASRAPYRDHFAGWRSPWNYASAEVTRQRLARAGFDTIETWLQDRPTAMQQPRTFVATVCLVRHLDPLPPPLHDPFIDDVMDRLDTPVVLDYVRLNMTARRADATGRYGAPSHE